MSLINDAIKQAAHGKSAPPPPSDPQLGMQAVPNKRPVPTSPYLIPIALVFTLGLGIIFLVKGWQTGLRVMAQQPQEEPLPVAAQEPPPPQPPVTPPVHPKEEINSHPLVNPAERPQTFSPAQPAPQPKSLVSNSTHQMATTDAELSPPSPIPPPIPMPSFPQLKLQGIYYRPTNPSVLINSETLFQGDQIQEVRIAKITKQSVTLVWKNETKVLTLR